MKNTARELIQRGANDSSASSSSRDDVVATPPAFVARMTHIPFVNSAISMYEQGKASSRMVKYGAEMVESSVKTISRPVINRLPVDVHQLDEFACRQLDKLDLYRHPSASENQPPSTPTSHMRTSPDPEPERGRQNFKPKTLHRSDEGDSSIQREEEWLQDSRSSTPTQDGDETTDSQNQNKSQVAQRSRWQAVLLEAGGLSAALSEESMRRLKYCLHWLQYATAYIDAHILFLRNFTADLQPLPSDIVSSSTRRPPISEEHMRRLIDVRRDIVHTIRQAVDIVSKYAGGALPEPARTRVRGFILTLPQRWASKASETGGVNGLTSAAGSERDSTVTAAASGSGATRRPGGQRRAAHRERGHETGSRSGASSRATSPCSSPRISRSSRGGEGGVESGRIPAGTALVAAQRILALATESLDMMRNVTGVMKDSLDRADAWVERLRTVGIQRGTQEREQQQPQVEDGDTSEFEFSHRSGGRGDVGHDNIPSSPLFSGSSSSSTAAWASVPSTPGGGTYTPSYVRNGASSPSGIEIPVGAMSLRYDTPRSGFLSLPDEEKEREEEGERVGRKVVDQKRIEDL